MEIQTSLMKMYVYVLDSRSKYLNEVRDNQRFTQISGVGFLNFVKLLLIEFIFIFA